MMKVALVLVSIAAAATSAGCGDAPSCDSAIRAAVKNVADGAAKPGEPAIVGLVTTCKREGWKPALRTCLSKAKTSAALTACVPAPGPETRDGARRSEAEINLEAISKGAAIYYLGHGRYPAAAGELTPSQPCCRPGGMTRCPSDPAAWDAVPVWSQLNFKLSDSHYFRYSFESDGTSFLARAVGDLDCDTNTAAFELQGSAADGTVFTRPPRAD